MSDSTKVMRATHIELAHDDAAIVFRADGSLQLMLPAGEPDDDMEGAALVVAALGAFLVSGNNLDRIVQTVLSVWSAAKEAGDVGDESGGGDGAPPADDDIEWT